MKRPKPATGKPSRQAIWIGVGVAALLVGLGAGGFAAVYTTLNATHEAQLTAQPLPVVEKVIPQAPQELQAHLDRLVEAYGEEVGVAVTEVEAGWTAGVDLERPYPQQSVSKLWVAITVLKAVDAGLITVDDWVTMTEADRSVFFQPLASRIGRKGYPIQVRGLLRRAIIESDNSANDKLMQIAGGPDGVRDSLTEMGLTEVKVGAYERDLQAQTAGMVWRPEYGVDWNFQHARERLPMAVRKAAMDAYLADPLDGTSPAAITRTLADLQNGKLLSATSTDLLIGMMTEARTGPRRLKGGLPRGWKIAHKTGTGQDFQGFSAGINDVGLLTAPDGRVYAVAVMMRKARKGVTARLAFMQSISRAVVAEWERSRDEPLAPDLRMAETNPFSGSTVAD
jgi:beta-lactamase class A